MAADKRESHPKKSTSVDWQQRDLIWGSALPTMEKVVLLAFLECDRLGRGRELYPSIERVAWQTGYANSTVRKMVRNLERAGILEHVGHIPSRYALRGRVNRYRFHIDRLPARPTWVPRVDSRRATAPVDADSRRNTAPVDPATAAVPERDSRRARDDSRRNTH